jgi:hypothetical protein
VSRAEQLRTGASSNGTVSEGPSRGLEPQSCQLSLLHPDDRAEVLKLRLHPMHSSGHQGLLVVQALLCGGGNSATLVVHFGDLEGEGVAEGTGVGVEALI